MDEIEDKNGWVTIDLDTLDDYKEPKFEDEDDLEDEPKAKSKVEEDDEDFEDDLAEDEPKVEEVRKGRAQERIQQLVTKEKAAKAELEAALEKIRELEDGITAKTRTNAETQKTLIDNQISVVKDSLRRAKEDGDVDKELDLQEKLSNLQVDKRIVEAQVSKIPAKSESKTNTRTTEPTLPEEMRYWLEDNSWALKPTTDEDKRKIRAIRKISSDLSNEGYLDSEADFYSELDDRLKKVFASKGVDGVEYKSKDTESSSRDVKQRKSPVSTSSRVPVSRRNRVSLSPSETQIADKLNMDPKRYAARKQAKEESNGDWTVIG